jgi:uncharacterized lipoprotein NlpE involved in copper resistance
MIRRTALLALLVFALPACTDDTSTSVETSFAGTYSIQTFNGHTLPYTNDAEILNSGTLVLKTDNTWTVNFVSQHVGGGDASFSDHGTYTITGNNLALTSASDATVTTGVFTGTTLTVDGDDGVYVLKKN